VYRERERERENGGMKGAKEVADMVNGCGWIGGRCERAE